VNEESDIRIRTSLASAPFTGDPVILVEALKNVLQNAIAHGHGDAETVEVEVTSSADRYDIAIADHGPGIAAENRARMFERFVRGGSGATGAGIGLAIVRRAVESHGGSVELLDREGGGLRVLISLPRGAG
jgi:two-component system sensor histidine kinase TctE